MNLFTFQTASGSGFAISEQFWIFIVIAVPLTVATMGLWLIMSRRRKKQRIQEQALQLVESGGEKQEV